MDQPPEERTALYQHLHENQLREDRDFAAHSATRFLEIALKYFEIKSMLDIGCGLGTWLYVAQHMGIEVLGVEGPWCETDKLEVDKSLVLIQDLEKPVSVGGRFSLAISLEVGEHLSPAAAPLLVKSLTDHSDHVLFSAAVPYQGGHHHVNEQFLSYWAELFAVHGYVPVDIFRGPLWKDKNVLWWLRQNAVLFASPAALDASLKLKAETEIERPLDIIFPDFYRDRYLQLYEQFFNMQQALLQSGKARVRQTPNGPVLEIV